MDWFQIVITDPEALPGRNLIRLLRLLAMHVPVTMAVIDNVGGAGSGIRMLRPGSPDVPLVLKISELIEQTSQITQFDWGDFFLFENVDRALNFRFVQPYYLHAVAESCLTIRAVDDTYFYVYTRSRVVATSIRQAYDGVEVKKCSLDKLDFPE